MKKEIFSTALIIIFLFVLNNCSGSSTNSNDGKGTLQISLTDAPAAYDSVIIHFNEISAHIDSDWVHVNIEPQRVNLLDWSNGETMLLGSADIPSGDYSQIRLIIDSAFVGINGEVHELDVPSGSKTGLKLGIHFTINEGSTYEMVLDFDACRSIVVTGPKRNPHGYKLKPTIRVVTRGMTGSISGNVLNAEAMPVAYALNNGDTITTSIVDTTSGFFKLAFLPENSYTVIVEDTLGRTFLSDSVSIIVGNNIPFGEITLN